MDFGKLPNISRVDFRLPPLGGPAEERSLAVLRRASPLKPARVGVGAPIWGQRLWSGRVYPLRAKPSDFLELYSRQFNTIELNTTHYRIPTPETVAEWRAQTPNGFRFCPKWPQEISHQRELQNCEPLTEMFCDSLSRLGDRLGSSFLQLSPAFHPRQLPILRRFLEGVPRGFPVCVEFRHPAWFTHGALVPEALEVLEHAGAGTVITDVAGRRDVTHVSLTAPRVLIRFVGNQLDSTDYSRIDAWIPRLKLWLENGLRELEFFVHQPGEPLEPELISYFIGRLNAATGTRLKDWTRMDQGTQLSLL
jgi:uncharacterized protein YecE (DUF72 family)